MQHKKQVSRRFPSYLYTHPDGPGVVLCPGRAPEPAHACQLWLNSRHILCIAAAGDGQGASKVSELAGKWGDGRCRPWVAGGSGWLRRAGDSEEQVLELPGEENSSGKKWHARLKKAVHPCTEQYRIPVGLPN